MRLSFFLAALLVACTPAPTGVETADPTTTETVRRLAAMLDYVAADYAGAVADGRVVDQPEYDEQLIFLRDAGALLAELPPETAGPFVAELAEVRELVTQVAPSERVATSARGLRKRLLAAFGVVFAPTSALSMERARELYGAVCAQCHGAGGAADTPMAAQLRPPPRSFLDPAVMAELSPVRVFNALTDGIEDTAMASYGTLSASDRWSLAFFVFGLRHGEEDGAWRAAYESGDQSVPTTAVALAQMTDAELVDALARSGVAEDARPRALAYLRVQAPFESTGAPMDRARELLAEVVAAAHEGKASAARRLAAAAYLDGFEPFEAALRARDDALVVRLEQEFLDLRTHIPEREISDADRQAVEQRVLRLGLLLDTADQALRGAGGAKVSFFASLAVVLREGLEGALLIMLLLGMVRGSGGSAGDRRAVHLGWLVAVGVGVVTWFLSSTIIDALGGARRELIEGVVALLAAVVLLLVSHFVLARLDAGRRVAAFKEKLGQAISTPRRRLVLASLAFVAVYREAFETVLFLQAILLDSSSNAAGVLAGLLAGLLGLVGLVIGMNRIGRRLRPGPLLFALGLLLCLLSVALAGKGVRALQEAGVVDIHPVAGVHFDWLGMYPTVETIAAQSIALGVFLALTAWSVMRGRTRAAMATARA